MGLGALTTLDRSSDTYTFMDGCHGCSQLNGNVMFKVPNKYRISCRKELAHIPITDQILMFGNNGDFLIPNPFIRKQPLRVIASDGLGWEHVSVSLKERCPTWPEMCVVKNLFWDAEDCVIQFHPPKSDYVNNHPFCLHMWKKIGSEFELPENILV